MEAHDQVLFVLIQNGMILTYMHVLYVQYLDHLIPCWKWRWVGIVPSLLHCWTSLSSMPLIRQSLSMPRLGWRNPQIIFLDLLVIDAIVKLLLVHG